jgi:hypothetical protein
MNREQRQAEIARLRVEYREALAIPSALDGNIAPAQVGRMGRHQRKRYDRLLSEKFAITGVIQELSKSDAQLDREATANAKIDAESRISRIDSRSVFLASIGTSRKTGKMKLAYQRELDKMAAERAELVVLLTEVA